MTKEEIKELGLCEKYPKCFSNYYSYNQCPKFKSGKNKCTRCYEYRKDNEKGSK